MVSRLHRGRKRSATPRVLLGAAPQDLGLVAGMPRLQVLVGESASPGQRQAVADSVGNQVSVIDTSAVRVLRA